MKWQWPERSGRPSRQDCFKGASHFGGLHGLCSSFHFTAWTDQVCNARVWSTVEASFHSKRFQQYRIWAECESDVAQDILTMFHRCFSLKETTSWSKWTTPKKAERRIRCRMQRFCLRLSINRKALAWLESWATGLGKLPITAFRVSVPAGSFCDSWATMSRCKQVSAKLFWKKQTPLEQSCWELKVRLRRNHTTFQ